MTITNMITIFGMACQVSNINPISTIVISAMLFIINIKNVSIFLSPIKEVTAYAATLVSVALEDCSSICIRASAISKRSTPEYSQAFRTL